MKLINKYEGKNKIFIFDYTLSCHHIKLLAFFASSLIV